VRRPILGILRQIVCPRILLRFTLLLSTTLAGALASAAGMAVDPLRREISIALTTEPPSLNTIKATDAESFRILDHITEGLLAYDADNHLGPGVAERWELTDAGATFWLRRDARWDDGVAVTANDFVFAWREALRPSNASEYAFLLYPIRNAEEINRGELPPEALGVRAVDDYTLEVEFNQPCGYFLALTAFITYRPIREDIYRPLGERYAADAADMRYNGPFRLTEWVHGARLRMEKNALYWNSAAIELEAINVPYITEEPSAVFNLFKDDKVALSSLDASTMREALNRRMKIKKFFDGTLFYLEFNHREGRLTRNVHLRRAMQLAFDPEEFVAKIVRIPGNAPALSLFPTWIPGIDDLFRYEHPPRDVEVDLAAARRELELAKQELGLQAIPPLVLLLGDTPASAKQAEYLQERFARTLGLKLKLDKQIFKQRLAKMTAGDFDIVASGWGPDYNDAMTFGDLMSTWNMNNRGRYSNPEYDRFVRVAQGTSDPVIRNEAFAKLQDIVIDQVVVLPQYERGYVYVQHPRLTGVKRRLFGGDPNYMYARITD